MNWKDWAIDAGMSSKDMLCYIPVEFAETESPVFVTGMNVLASPDEPPGKIAAVVHASGDEAAQRWCADNATIIERVKTASAKKFPDGR